METCAKKNRDCWGEVAVYSFDIDLPNLALCKGHVWSLFAGASRQEKLLVAEELEDLRDDA